MAKLIFLDCETTSYNPAKCGVYQISGIVDIDNQATEEFNIFSDIFDTDEVMAEAFEKNKSSIEKIHQMPHPLKSFSKFCTMLRKYADQYDKTDKFHIIGYNNTTFDDPVLRRWFSQNGSKWYGSFFWHPQIDVMQLAAYILLDKRAQMENFRLGTVAEFLGLKVLPEESHDGLCDARLTRQMYYELTR
jgi:DNA polymerase III subunit epsilon